MDPLQPVHPVTKHVCLTKQQATQKFAYPRHMRQAGAFDYPAVQVGTSQWKGQDNNGIGVWYDPSLGQAGKDMAMNVLSRIDALMNYCDQVFGVKGKSGNVVIAPLSNNSDGTGGAYHYGCSFNADGPGSDWYEDMAIGKPDEVFGLVMAEVCESYMGLQGKGWNCGGSGGEGLSRFLAEIVSGGASGAMVDYSAGPSWGGEDWISADQGTDGDYPSIGAAILYCWWMTKLGFTPAQIIQAGEPDGTLATNYATLTGKQANQAFVDFSNAVHAVGGPGNFQNDNPFGAATPPYPLGPTPPNPPVCPAGQHWDPATNTCVPDGPPPPPPPPPTTMTFKVPFPQGLMQKTDLRDWIAKGVTGSGTMPDGSSLTIVIPDTYAHVEPLHGTGTVDAFEVQCTISAATNGAGTDATITVPPWALFLLKVLCGIAPMLPPPYGPLLVSLCALLPKNAIQMALKGESATITIPAALLAKFNADCAGCN